MILVRQVSTPRARRDRCTATRRDGEPCQAPAVEGTFVCRRHGGAAPQVQIAARHRQLQMQRYVAYCEWQEARGTPREFDALCDGPHGTAPARQTHGTVTRTPQVGRDRMARVRQARKCQAHRKDG